MLHPHQRAFLDTALASGVLRFGDFTLKSGRQSPYFFNMGRIDSGRALAEVGTAYAATLATGGIAFDMLFGPAYKGIPLAAAAAIALAREQGRDVSWAYNRKEAKDHGEGGALVGAPLAGRVMIVDDVITAGTAVRESLGLIRTAGAEVAGVLVALDRQERGQGELSATQELRREQGVPTLAIVGLADLMEFAGSRSDLAGQRPRLEAYRARYGAG
ncbi:MAG TPA: orotate phosphoribosyltransferase [Rhodanobacteraceae bacterium]|nr:orotate phosphoribosyltransferase [Rhodanobacteraceae bacterium]